jgi:predicted PurR-regulated permease PerM
VREPAFRADGAGPPGPAYPVRAFVAIGLAFFTISTLYLAAGVLVPVVAAIVVWFVLNAMAKGAQRLPLLGGRLSRGAALLLATLAALLVGFLVVQNAIATLTVLAPRAAGFRQALDPLVDRLAGHYGFVEADMLDRVFDGLRLEVALWQLVTAMVALASQAGIVAIYVAFLLVDQQFFEPKLAALFPDSERRDRVRSVLDRIAGAIMAYLQVMTLMSILTAVLSYAVMRLTGLEYAFFWATMIFFLNYIPTIGSILGTVLPAVFALLQFKEIWPAFLVLAGIGVVQFVIGNILLPRVSSGTLNISLFVTLFSLFAFGALWGVTGMFVAMPLTAILIITFSYFETTRPISILLSRDGDVVTPAEG